MKGYADKIISERTFKVGDKVFLCLQPYKPTVSSKGNRKLSPQFFRPYKVLQWVGQVAYKLELPIDSKIHPIFHVSCLKKKLGESIIPIMELLMTRKGGQLQLEPVSVLDRRGVKQNHHRKTQWWVQLMVKFIS